MITKQKVKEINDNLALFRQGNYTEIRTKEYVLAYSYEMLIAIYNIEAPDRAMNYWLQEAYYSKATENHKRLFKTRYSIA